MITIITVLIKLVARVAAKGTFQQKLLVGGAMVPRGEVGLIFAAVGREKGILTGELYSTILLVIILTTLVSPLLIKFILTKHPQQ